MKISNKIAAVTTCLAPALVLFLLITETKIGIFLLAIWLTGLYLELHYKMESSYVEDPEEQGLPSKFTRMMEGDD